MPKKPHLLFINNSSRIGIGTSSVLLSIVKYLRQNYQISVVSDKHSPQLSAELEKLNVRHYGLPDRIILYYPSLIKLITEKKIDLVYGNGNNNRSWGGMVAAKFTNRPFILHVHEYINDTIYSKTMHIANEVITNSQDSANRIKELTKVKKLHMVFNGIDTVGYSISKDSARKYVQNQLGLEDDTVRIISVGRICEDKNQEEIIEIANKLFKKYTNLVFIILGHIHEQSYYNKIIDSEKYNNFSDKIKFLGYTDKVKNFMNGSDIFLHSARKEPQGLVILEAMASGLPIVAYDVGGIKESVINQKVGFLSPLGNIEDMSVNIEKLILDKNLRTEMGSIGKLHVSQNFDEKKLVQEIENIIVSTISKKFNWEKKIN